MNRYKVELTKQAQKDLKHIDKHQAEMILNWIEKNLKDCENPRVHGKPLEYNLKGYWRYRIGIYRLIAKIEDNIITIAITNIGNRKNIYKNR